METCVLMPSELVVGERKVDLPKGQNADDTATSKLGVFSLVSLLPGTSFYAVSGNVHVTRIDCQTKLRSLDVRNGFGCYDDIQRVNGHSVRHCNWIRFVQSVSKVEDANMVAVKMRGKPVFQAVKVIPAHTELLVYFSTTDHSVSSILKETKLPIPAPLQIPMYMSPWQRRPMLLPGATQEYYTNPTSPLKIDSHAIIPTSLNLITPPPEDDKKMPIPSPLHDSRQHYLQQHQLHDKVSRSDQYLGIIRRSKERAMLPCEVCRKVFDRPSLLKRHMRTHTGERPHQCNVCGKAFSTSSSLNTHQRIHSGEKPHQCTICGKRFTASSNLYYHKMTHQKEKPHKCTLCSKSFPTPGDLKCHMYVHNGSWPYKCGLCNRGFSKQTNLRNHLMLHTGERPYECTLCGKRFALPCNLKAHMKTHDDTKVLKCCTCNKTFLCPENTNQKACYNCKKPLTTVTNDIPAFKTEEIEESLARKTPLNLSRNHSVKSIKHETDQLEITTKNKVMPPPLQLTNQHPPMALSSTNHNSAYKHWKSRFIMQSAGITSVNHHDNFNSLANSNVGNVPLTPPSPNLANQYFSYKHSGGASFASALPQ